MTDRDLIAKMMQEAQRLNAEPVGPNESEPAMNALRDVLNPKEEQSALADLNLDRRIHLRWVLRDIKGKRTKIAPVSPNDLSGLIEMGLVEMRDDTPALTDAGYREID